MGTIVHALALLDEFLSGLIHLMFLAAVYV